MADTPNSLVSTQWLDDHLNDPNVIVLDASKHLSAANRNPRAEFETAHIPSARYLDLDTLTDKDSSVPAALPTSDQVAQRLSEVGAAFGNTIVLYDDSAVKTSARAWFALTVNGVANVSILDGGLAKWRTEGRRLEAGASEAVPVSPMALAPLSRVRSKADMLANLDTYEKQVLDARGADRVFGHGIDPVHGGQNGRIPGALNLPFGKVFREDGTYHSADKLRHLFASEAGVDLGRPIITSCGSGVTASVLLFALHLAGHDTAALYDGSWQEWEADPHTPKQQGPA